MFPAGMQRNTTCLVLARHVVPSLTLIVPLAQRSSSVPIASDRSIVQVSWLKYVLFPQVMSIYASYLIRPCISMS